MNLDKDTIYLTIANFIIKIHFKKTEWVYFQHVIKKDILNSCRFFLCEKVPLKIDCTLEFEELKQLNFVVKKNEGKNFAILYENSLKKKITTFYYISIFQFHYILLSILFQLLTEHEGFILHGSASNVSGKACIFLGKNGAGKSTIKGLLSKKFSPLADDITIIRKDGSEYFFFPIPTNEKSGFVTNSSQKLSIGKIFFLNKSSNFKIQPIHNPLYITKKMIQQTLFDPHRRDIQSKIVFEFISKFHHYFNLYFAKKSQPLIALIENS